VESDFVVDVLDELVDVLSQLLQGAVAAGVDFLPLQRLDEALALAVFPWPCWPAHTDQRSQGFQSLHELVARII